MILIDRYTKTVLTVIAVSLAVLALNSVRADFVAEALAAGDSKDVMDVRIIGARSDITINTEVSNADEIGKHVAAWLRKRQTRDGGRDSDSNP
jgi:hypothetical protein